MAIRTRITVLTTLGILMFGAISATTALATPSITDGPFFTYKNARLPLNSKLNIKDTSPAGVLYSQLDGVKIKIECKKDVSTGTITNGTAQGEDSGTITFEECTLYEQTSTGDVEICKIPNIIATVVSQLWYHSTNTGTRTTKIQKLLLPKPPGVIFTEFETGSGCKALANMFFPVEGDLSGEVTPANVEATSAKILFLTEQQKRLWRPIGSGKATEIEVKLTFGGKKTQTEATLQGTDEVELSSKENFGVEF